MKKVVAGVVALLVLAYPAATWWTGKQVESRLAEQYKSVEQVPFIKVVKRDYQRGFTSSTEVVTFEIMGDLIRGLADLEPKAEGDGKAPEPLTFTVRSVIKHGPFAGGQMAAAVSDSELVIDEAAKKDLAKVFGDQKPIAVHTVIGFDGGGRSTVESPAFTHLVEGAGGGKLTWGGIKADLSFTRDVDSFTLQGTMPKLEIKDDKGVHMLMSDIRMSGDQKRLFKDEPLLYGGSQRFEVAQIQISAPMQDVPGLTGESGLAVVPTKPVSMKNVVYVVDIPFNGGEFMDISARMSSASILVDQQEYGPAHYDLSMKHLHARTIAKLYRAAVQMYADPAALKRDPGAAMSALAEPAKELLGHNPEFALERISFTSAHGEAKISASVKLKDAKPEDLALPMALVGKVDATADLKLPAALLADLGSAKAQSPDEKEAHKQMFTAQVDALAQQGYVTNTNGVLESKFSFQGGKLSINGKPFDPRALAGAGAGAPGEEDDEEDAQTPPPVPPAPGRPRQ